MEMIVSNTSSSPMSALYQPTVVETSLVSLQDCNENLSVQCRSYVEPTDHDVLCGRGMDCFRHEGNIRFRALIDTKLYEYTMSNSKKHKMQIIQEVVQTILNRGGRFLKKENRQWYDGGIACGKDKVGHSFRDAKGYGRKKLSKVLQDLNYKNPRDLQLARKQASLTEENEGAVALAAFKLGHQQRQIIQDSTKLHQGHLYGTNEVHIPSGDQKLPYDALSKEVGDSVDTFHEYSGIAGGKVHSSTQLSIQHDNEDQSAASSLLFLQRAVDTNWIERRKEESRQIEGSRTAIQLSSSTTANSTFPFRQACAASVPSEAGGNSTFYYI